MNKLLLSMIALAAISSATISAERGYERSYELRDSDTYFGKYSTQLEKKRKLPYASKHTEALKAADDGAPLTAYERMLKTSAENENGGH